MNNTEKLEFNKRILKK